MSKHGKHRASRGASGRNWRRLLVLTGAIALFAGTSLVAMAVHNDGLFELDRDTASNVPFGGNDWDEVYLGTSDAIASVFIADKFNDGTDDIFDMGGSKDDLDIPNWMHTTQNVQPKNDITNAFAAAYSNDADDLIVYLGLDRWSNNGDAQIGFWLLQEGFAKNLDGSFVGAHTVGDLLVQAEFTNGGAIDRLQVFEWVGSGGDTNDTLNLVANGIDCDIAAAGDFACGVVNKTDGAVDPAWDFETKVGNQTLTTYLQGEFFEMGVNVSQLIDGFDGCLAGFVAETRSSQAVDSTLSDLAAGNLNTCPDVQIEKTPDGADYFQGDTFDWTLEVTNVGAAAEGVLVEDTIPDGLTINSATWDRDPTDGDDANTCTILGQDVACLIGDLDGDDDDTDPPEGDTAVVTINVTATAAVFDGTDAGCVEINNTGTVSADREDDDDLDNNTDDGNVTVCRLSVDKDVSTSFNRYYDWTIDKKVDGVETATFQLFEGDTANPEWQVVASRVFDKDSDWTVTGTITVTNPADIAATVDVTDVISDSGAVLADQAAVVDCDPGAGTSTSLVIAANSAGTCTYATATSSAEVNPFGDTNTATATLDNGAAFDVVKAFTFTTTPTDEIDESATLTDARLSASIPSAAGATQIVLNQNELFTCDNGGGSYDNSATVTEGDSGENATDGATVVIECYGLSVSKDANTSYTRYYDWDITKKVNGQDAVSYDLFEGDSQDVDWQVTATRSFLKDADWAVQGEITITNNHPTQAANGVSVSDSLPGGTVAVDCDSVTAGDQGTVDIAALGSATCSYSSGTDANTTTNPYGALNTATAALTNGSSYQGTADVVFSDTPSSEYDETATLTDPRFTIDEAADSGVLQTYPETFTCDNGGDTYKNDAAVTADDSGAIDNADAFVTIACYGLDVEKDATTDWTRYYEWTLTKKVDGQDEVTLDMFAGDSQDVEWKVSAVRKFLKDADWAVTGDIKITNNHPTADAVGVAVSDVISDSGFGPADVNAVVDCDPIAAGAQATVTVPKGDSVTCSYSAETDSSTTANPFGDTNTATAQLTNGSSYTGTAAVVFSATPSDEIGESADLSDPRLYDGVIASAGETTIMYTESETFACDRDSGRHANVATLDISDGLGSLEADAFVNVNCFGISVEKDANTSWTRYYQWDIVKKVNGEDSVVIDVFEGDTTTVTWNVEATRSHLKDADWKVEGDIMITNSHPTDAALGVVVTDVISDSGALVDVNAVVDCDPGAGTSATVDVPADSTVTCSYTAATDSSTTVNPFGDLNTATAELTNGTTASGTAAVVFSDTPSDEVDETATVADLRLFPTGTDLNSFSVDETFTCNEDDGNHINDASVTADDTGTVSNADADVTIRCRELTVSKTANTFYTRTYDWDIDKFALDSDGFPLDPTGTNDVDLVLQPGQSYTLDWKIVATNTGYTDSDWYVTGDITVTNPHPTEAATVSVTDVVSDSTAALADIGAVVDCDPATAGDQDSGVVPAAGSLTCSYRADAPAAATSNPFGDTNTATATNNALGTSYSGTAGVAFGAPTTLIDEQVTVYDDPNETPLDTSDDVVLGTATLSESPKSFIFSEDLLFTTDDCGINRVGNRAWLITNDQGLTAEDTDAIGVDVPCLEGCTLTIGYWKTHSDWLAPHGPSYDFDWHLLGDRDGDGVEEYQDEMFYSSGLSYIEIMWTPSQGNAYYNLAHQYIGTLLNSFGAAVPTDVAAAMADAEAFFAGNGPEVFEIKGKGSNKSMRKDVLAWHSIFAAYNEGDIGPGHCDEDGNSRL